MRLASISLATLSLNRAFWFAEGNSVSSLDSIDRYELISIESSETTPGGEIDSVEPFQGKIYFESHASTSLNQSDDNHIPITIELFAKAPLSDSCDKGTPIEIDGSRVKTEYFKMSEGESSYKAYEDNRSTSDGVIGVGLFTIIDFEAPFVSNGEPVTIFTIGSTGTVIVNLCVRSSIKIKSDYDPSQNGLEYVSFADSHLTVNIKTSVFGDFIQSVSITKPKVKEQGTSNDKSIDLESFLCGDNDAAEFTIGQTFQVCVQPTDQYASEYYISDFKNVICKNTYSSRELVDAIGNTDPLTTVIDSNGIKSNDKTKNAGPSSKAFKSIVSAGYFGIDATSISCEGEVEFSISRRLTPNFLHNSHREHLRDLQETTNIQGSIVAKDSTFTNIIRLFSNVDGSGGANVDGSGGANVDGSGGANVDGSGGANVDDNGEIEIQARDPNNQPSKSPSELVDATFIQTSTAFVTSYFEWGSRFMVVLAGAVMIVMVAI